ncbi:MAG: hypothetical protein D6730_21935 [Bacteroidetes bacterium]|nr:MAG: hypothetical protein D6730_21935 [Bacteroidota bacterium]
MKRATVPWIIALLMCVYVFGLTYHAKNRPPPDPAYDFYDTTLVEVFIFDFQDLPDVYGRYNNIVEGERQLVEAIPDNAGHYRLAFKVNSPRPAVLYIDDEALEILLVPDSTLSISLYLNPSTNRPDSLQFVGYTAPMCQYYLDKSRTFSEVQSHLSRNTLKSEDFADFSRKLDEMALEELRFLSSYGGSLPHWFFNFERSEILYQKAYLKLANAYKREVPAGYLDEVALNNEDAVFSYYYYLYLKSYLAAITEHMPLPQTPAWGERERRLLLQMAVADTLLRGEVHDVFLTRMIFNQLKQNQMDFAAHLLEAYRGHFNRRKYERFLQTQYREKTAQQPGLIF